MLYSTKCPLNVLIVCLCFYCIPLSFIYCYCINGYTTQSSEISGSVILKLLPSTKKHCITSVRNSSKTIIIIMSCRQHRYPWPSLDISPYRSSPLAGLEGYIPYPHRAVLCMLELADLILLGYMWGSIGVYHLWDRPCFSSSVLYVWFV